MKTTKNKSGIKRHRQNRLSNLKILTSQTPKTRKTTVNEIALHYQGNIKIADSPKIGSSYDANSLFQSQWNLSTMQIQEQFKIMLLNNSNRVKGIYEVSTGGITGTMVDIRIIFCDRNGCIIVGGSGLEPIGNDFYSFCPIFIPNSPIIKIYKKQITHPEITLSNGKIIAYPDEVQRRIELNLDDRDISFSVYICYDFLIENKNKRTDLIFVPQYEASPEQFITESDKISKGYTNFVFGANNCNNNQRSLGFAVLNRALIESLHIQQLRREAYRDAENNTLNYDHTIFYDVNDERLMTFDVNIGRPFSLPYNFTLNGHQPVLIPRRNMPI